MLLLDVLKGQKVNSIPVIATGAGLAREWLGVSWEDFRSKGSVQAEVQINFQRQTGIDWVLNYSDALAIEEIFGCTIRFSPVSGPLMDQQLSLPDFKPLPKVDYYSCKSSAAVLEAVEISARIVKDVPIGMLFEGPLTTALRMFDPQIALRTMFKNPGLIRGVLEYLTEVLVGFGVEGIKKGATVFHIPEPFSSMDFISARHFRDFSQPYITRLIESLHQQGGHVVLHMCGNTAGIWPNMVETGARALSLDQKMSMADARAAVGDKVALAGNVDPIKALMMGDKEAVRTASVACIQDAGPQQFILMPGCGTPPGTPLENVQEMVKTAKEYVIR